MAEIRSRINIFILVFNIYLLISLFIGKNTIINYITYTKEYKKLLARRNELLKQRYQLEKMFYLLSDKDKDSYDILDELLRQTTQSSLPNEKIIILNN